MLRHAVANLGRNLGKTGTPAVTLLSKTCASVRHETTSTRRPLPGQMPTLLDIGSRNIFNTDHDLFREQARKFFRQHVSKEAVDAWAAKGEPSREVWKKAGEAGLLGIPIPAEVGGVGATFLEAAIATEEHAYVNSLAPSFEIHSEITLPYLHHYATKEQLEKYMPGCISGDIIAAIAMTEPGAGSDLQGIRTRAVKSGDDWILNGSKTFITNGWLADVVLVYALSDPSAKKAAHGASIFMVDAGTPGFHKANKLKKMGCEAQDTAELFFEDVRLPASQVLGEVNKGFYYLMNELPQERLSIAMLACAHAEWMFEETRTYVNERKAFGGSLSAKQTIQHKLAEMKTEICVTRSFIDDCIATHADKGLDSFTASMAKYYATDLENKVAYNCVQLHGGMGYMKETPICRAFLDARVQTIYAGANEIMKELIARPIVSPAGKVKL